MEKGTDVPGKAADEWLNKQGGRSECVGVDVRGWRRQVDKNARIR